MGKIYVGQTALKITLNTASDLTNAASQLIKYRKPSGISGQFTAVVDDAPTGVISYTVTAATATDIDLEGEWVFWAFINYNDGTVISGEPKRVTIYREGY